MSASVASPQPIEDLSTPLSNRNRSWRRFRRHKMAIFGSLLLGGLLMFVIIGSLTIPYDRAVTPNVLNKLKPPSAEHPFGTDQIGQDVLARAVYGGQLSLIIGVLAMLLSIGVGTAVGAIAGYYGGMIDSVLMRFTEAILTIPRLFLLLTMSKFFGGRVAPITFAGREFSGSVIVIIIIIGVTSWTSLARIIRAQILSLKQMEYVVAARSLGIRNRAILMRHILPNTLASIIVSATLGIAGAILSEAYISFLGLGVDSKTPTWGNLINLGYQQISKAPWMWLVPGILIVVTVLGINFVGDGLRDALDPRSTKA